MFNSMVMFGIVNIFIYGLYYLILLKVFNNGYVFICFIGFFIENFVCFRIRNEVLGVYIYIGVSSV